ISVAAATPPVAIAAGAGAILHYGVDTVLDPDHTVNSYLERTYGGAENMTTAQATEFSTRYDGWAGFGRFVGDGVYGFGNTVTGNVGDAADAVADGARNLWDRVF